MDRPNILIFMTDHQRGDTVLPEHGAKTSNLDRLVREGVAFTNAFCPSPHCCPARATFMSGLYPSRHGVWNNVANAQALSRGPRPGVRLWSEDLAQAGYALHYSGKWHVSADEGPAERGWTERFVHAGPRAPAPEAAWDGYRKLAQSLRDGTAEGAQGGEREEGEIVRPGYPAYRLYGERPYHRETEEPVVHGLEALDDVAKGADPWCVYVGTSGPHDPYRVPQRFIDLYRPEDVPLPASYADEMADKPRIYRRMREQIWGQLSEREVREGVRHFWAYCSYLDDLFGRLLDRLDALGQAENTLVLYCSDHGDYCGDHGLFCKGIPCFRGAYHVPAVVRWPAGAGPADRREDAFVSLADWAPTFLELAGVRAQRAFTGASLAPLLRGETPPAWRDEIHTQCNGVELYYTQRSVMTRAHKYVFNGFDDDELYDLAEDPDELVNRAADPAYAEVKRGLCRRMWRFAYEQGDTAISSYITVGLAPWGPAEAFR